jgi:hypothetical protein
MIHKVLHRGADFGGFGKILAANGLIRTWCSLTAQERQEKKKVPNRGMDSITTRCSSKKKKNKLALIDLQRE